MTANEIQIIDEFKEMAKTPLAERRCRPCEYAKFKRIVPERAKLVNERRFEELAKEAGYEFPAFCKTGDDEIKDIVKRSTIDVIKSFQATGEKPPTRKNAKKLTEATVALVSGQSVPADIISNAVDEAAEEMRFTFAGETPLDPKPERDPLTNLIANLLTADTQLAELRRLIADSLGKLDRIQNMK